MCVCVCVLYLYVYHVELITRLSDGCSLVLVEAGALPVLYDVINGTNRNRASLLLVETTLQILLNLTKVSVLCLHECKHVCTYIMCGGCNIHICRACTPIR